MQHRHGRAKLASRQETGWGPEPRTAQRRSNAAFVVPRLRGIRALGAATQHRCRHPDIPQRHGPERPRGDAEAAARDLEQGFHAADEHGHKKHIGLVVTPMGQVAGVPRQHIAVGAWHCQKLPLYSAPYSKKEASKNACKAPKVRSECD